jgi:hypothetical protein
VLKEPSHGRISIAVTSSEQCLLTSDGRETHRFKLRHGSGVKLGSGSCSSQLCRKAPRRRKLTWGSIHVQILFSGLTSFAEILVEIQVFRYIYRNVCDIRSDCWLTNASPTHLRRHPVDQLEFPHMQYEKIRVRFELGRPVCKLSLE